MDIKNAPSEIKTQMPKAPQVKSKLKVSLPDKPAPPSNMNLPNKPEIQMPKPVVNENINLAPQVKNKAPIVKARKQQQNINIKDFIPKPFTGE